VPRQPDPWSWRGRLSCIMPYLQAALVLAAGVALVKLLWSIL